MTQNLQSFFSDSTVFGVFCAVIGLLVGSFLNVVIHRLPKMMDNDWRSQCAELHGQATLDAEVLSLSVPRSRCPQCGHPSIALENIIACAVAGKPYFTPCTRQAMAGFFSTPFANRS